MNIKKIIGLAALFIVIGVNVGVYAGLKDNPPKEPQGNDGGGTKYDCYCGGSWLFGRACVTNGNGSECGQEYKCWKMDKNCQR